MKHAHSLMSRELRSRTDALHRYYDRRPERSLDSLLNQCSSIGSTIGDTAQPFTTQKAIRDELQRHGKQDVNAVLSVRAGILVEMVADREPNPAVRATWAVERVKMEMSRALPFDHACPDLFVDGQAFSTRLDTTTGRRELHRADFLGLHSDDLDSIRHLHPIINDGVVNARWYPSHPCRVFDCDPIRPPVEALALIRRQVEDLTGNDDEDEISSMLWGQEFPSKSAICLGTGFTAAAQVLSVLLPAYQISNIPVPYHLPIYELDRLSRTCWDLVVLNIPSSHSWQVAQVLAGKPEMSFVKRRGVLQGRYAKVNPTGHIPALLDLVKQFLQPGAVLAILAEPDLFHQAVRLLGSEIEPLPEDQFGTDKRAVWIDYQTRPWAPHGLPQPTGRLVAFRRWK